MRVYGETTSHHRTLCRFWFYGGTVNGWYMEIPPYGKSCYQVGLSETASIEPNVDRLRGQPRLAAIAKLKKAMKGKQK